jgi:hypothetical protein
LKNWYCPELLPIEIMETNLIPDRRAELRRCLRALIVIFLSLAGCTAAGDRLSGLTGSENFGLTYPAHLESVRIGQTTKEEVRKIFGQPKDLQVSSGAHGDQESWAYAQADPSISPLQYVPILGVLALSPDQRGNSFSISFSDEDIVESVGIQEAQPYADGSASSQTVAAVSAVQPYGSNNPLTHHSTPDILR